MGMHHSFEIILTIPNDYLLMYFICIVVAMLKLLIKIRLCIHWLKTEDDRCVHYFVYVDVLIKYTSTLSRLKFTIFVVRKYLFKY